MINIVIFIAKKYSKIVYEHHLFFADVCEFWLTGHHSLNSAHETIKFLEIDDLGPRWSNFDFCKQER